MEKNYTIEQGKFASADGRTEAAYYVFMPKGQPRAIIQISHGMSEYAMRYEPLADYLTGLGYLVCAHDHVGHGASVLGDDELGYTCGAENMAADIHLLSVRMRERYPDTPWILLGHSMGSFVARLYAALYPSDASALVIVGTAGPGNPTALGKGVAKVVSALRGDKYRSKLITKMAFGGYNKRFPREGSENSWLSRDRAVVEAYDGDPLCGFTFTAKGYYDLFDLIGRVSKPSWATQIPRSLPVFMISGEQDPVGSYGRGVEKVYERLQRAGVEDVTLKLYPDMRHEIFNEIGRETVYADLAAWLSEHNF